MRCVEKSSAHGPAARPFKAFDSKSEAGEASSVGGWVAGDDQRPIPLASLNVFLSLPKLALTCQITKGEGIEILRHGNDEFAGQTLLWAKLFPVEEIKTERVKLQS
jgi:hypothetical protein